MKALGFGFNLIPLATGVHIDMSRCSGVTFLCYENGGAQNAVFVQSIAGASGVALATINELYASSGVTAAVWTRETTDAGGALADNSTVVKKDTTAFDCMAIYIGADELAAGYDCIECTIDGAGLCIAITHGLLEQREPENLPTIGT